MEPLLASKIVNALIANATPNFALYTSLARATGLGGTLGEVQKAATESILSAFQEYYGGLWVGGKASLSPNEIAFAPNALNRVVHKGDMSFAIPLADVTDVVIEPSYFTKIIAIQTQCGAFKMRCYGATKFAQTIRQARERANNHPPPVS